MPTTYRATLTNVGAALVADAIASGTTLTWAKMALGDGNGSAVVVDASRTSLVNERYRAPLNDLGRDSANPNTIVGTLVVPPETGGWTIREFGIYDDASTPNLVAYGETPEIEKPASSEGAGINLRLRFKLVVSADANITLAPDSNEAYATIEYVKDNAVKSLSVSGRTITYTMGDGDTHTIQTQDTTYNDATQSARGLMSAADKTALDNVPSTYLKKAGDTASGAILSVVGSASVDGSRNIQFGGSMGNNDLWEISVGATANDAGFVEIATGDNGNEPIYIAQNNRSAGTSRRATLLDGSGNTVFPGSVTADGGFVGALTGNASSATQFSANKSVALTGDVTGSASSKAGWSVATTLANSGVTAGSYGPGANAEPAFGSTFNVPYVTVDAKGRVTAASTKTVKIPAQYSHPSYTARTGKPTANATPAFGGTFTVSQITSDATGHVTGATDRTITIPSAAFTKSGSSAAAGLVPMPSTTAGTTKYLREDATWQVPPNTVYTHPSYTARTGKPTANATPAFGGTFTVSQITSDATGHVTGATDRTITIPSAAFTKSGSSAAAGLVPKPSTTAGTTKYLREDATWQVPPYLPLSGGTLTGHLNFSSYSHITKEVDNSSLFIDGASSWEKGAFLRLAGQMSEGVIGPGSFQLAANNPSQSQSAFLLGTADGVLKWNGDHVARFVTGTFTPTVSGSTTAGSFTYTSQIGRYIVIGDLVFVHGRIVTSAYGTHPAGRFRINGLPFTSINVSSTYQELNVWGYSGGVNNSVKRLAGGVITANVNYIEALAESDSNNGFRDYATLDASASTGYKIQFNSSNKAMQIYFTGCYLKK